MSQDIMQLMAKSESVIDLEERLERSGKEFHNYKEYMRWLDAEWNRIPVDRINQVLETSPTETKFPTLTVESEGVEYQLHGINHGWSAYLAPGWYPRRNVRDYVSETADSFHRPFEGEDYLYEQKMRISFDLLRSQELKDKTRTNGKSESLLRDVGMIAASIPIALIALPTAFGGLYVYSRTIKNPQGEVQRFIYLLQKALTDESYQAQLADFCIAKEMQQPFNLEKEYLSQKGSRIATLVNSISMEPNAATPSERSLWTAGELRAYARRNGLNILHYIVGLAHTTEIAYFLKNPDFSFERLEEYRMRRR